MAHTHDHDPTVPRHLLIFVAVMLSFVIAIAGWSAYQKRQAAAERDAALAELVEAGEYRVRRLSFADLEDGTIAVLHGETREPLTAVKPAEDGFVRGVLRGFARERQARGIGPQPSFELILTEAGVLILSDPETGREVMLNAFGPTNAQAFGRLFFAGDNI